VKNTPKGGLKGCQSVHREPLFRPCSRRVLVLRLMGRFFPPWAGGPDLVGDTPGHRRCGHSVYLRVLEPLRSEECVATRCLPACRQQILCGCAYGAQFIPVGRGQPFPGRNPHPGLAAVAEHPLSIVSPGISGWRRDPS